MTSSRQTVHVHVLDMSDAPAVRQFASSFAAAGHTLDVLVRVWMCGCVVW